LVADEETERVPTTTAVMEGVGGLKVSRAPNPRR
jgi:hypothetical protein